MPSPSTLAVTYTFSNGQTSDATLWNTNYSDIVNFVNSSLFLGTVAVDNASAGYRGEYIESVSSTPVSAGTSTQYKNFTSISLTAGDWDVTGLLHWDLNGATWTSAGIAVSIYSNNTQTDHAVGSNITGMGITTAIGGLPVLIPNYRLSIATTNTVYLKGAVTFSAGTPNMDYGRISARRVR